jgi:hypothetical protein
MYLNLLKGTSVLGHMLRRWELYKLNGHKGEINSHPWWKKHLDFNQYWTLFPYIMLFLVIISML